MIPPKCVDIEQDIYIDGVLTWKWDGKQPTGTYPYTYFGPYTYGTTPPTP